MLFPKWFLLAYNWTPIGPSIRYIWILNHFCKLTHNDYKHSFNKLNYLKITWEAMNCRLICSFVAVIECFPTDLLPVIPKVKWIIFIVTKLNLHILQSIINCIVTLESQKTSRCTHGTHRTHKLVSTTWIKYVTCSLGLNFYCYFLYSNIFIWFLGIYYWPISILNLYKLVLVWRACIFTPKSFQINCTNITLSSKWTKYSINLSIWFRLLLVIACITAP